VEDKKLKPEDAGGLTDDIGIDADGNDGGNGSGGAGISSDWLFCPWLNSP
jgi:hypothetical protein